MVRIPELETDRLRLGAPVADHLGHYIDFFTDAEASVNYGGPLTESQAWARLAHDVGIWHLRNFGVWILTSDETGEVVGGCGFWQGLGWPRELTWWLLPQARGAGLAAEASQAAIRYAYEHLHWRTVQTYMADDNKPARALAIRLGGVASGRHRFPDDIERTIYLLPRPDGTYPDEPEVD